MKWNMRIAKITGNYLKFQHISKNHLKSKKSVDNHLILPRSNVLLKNKSNARLNKLRSVASTDTSSSADGVLDRYLDNLKCNVNVFGSTLVELEVKLDQLKYLRSRSRFLRKFSKIELVSNGLKFIPNEVQLFSLRPQLTGSDLLINSPKGSGKTFLYLLPHLMYIYLLDNQYNYVKEAAAHFTNQKVAVLLPTIDMVLDDSRTANGCFNKYKRVSSLLYKNIALNDIDHVLDSDLIYSTPKSFLKLLVRDTSIRSSVRFIIVDESERMVVGEFAYLLARIKNLLPTDSQFIFLSNFTNNHLLHQFTSRFLKLNFKIISFTNGSENRNKIFRHIYGPIRSIVKHISIYNSINSNDLTDNSIDLKVTDNNDIEPNLVHLNNVNSQGGINDDTTSPSRVEKRHEEPSSQLNGPFPSDSVRRLEFRVKQNRDLILNTKNRVALNDFKIEYVLYEPSRFLDALLSELDVNRKTLVYFPTVRMCQFCYVYLKHYLRPFSQTTCRDDHGSNDPKLNDRFMFYDFHTGLSLEKRRYVLDSFKLATRGFLFCTNLAIGINFYNVDKVIQVSFGFDVYELLNKFSHPARNENGLIKPDTAVSNGQKLGGTPSSERLLLLNNLDGHILYEYYKRNISVSFKNSFTSSSFGNRHVTEQPMSCCSQPRQGVFYGNLHNLDNTDSHQSGLRLQQLDLDIYLLSSCELMYRSLLGYYSDNAQRLKFDRWMIPSFFNEFLKSFGINRTFAVSKQFAVRTQLLGSPGLEVSNSFNRKSELISSLKSYPGFISKSTQSGITV